MVPLVFRDSPEADDERCDVRLLCPISDACESTKMAEAEIPQSDVAKVLNHVEGGPRATMPYTCYAYDKEKRLVLMKCERVLTGILEEKAANPPRATIRTHSPGQQSPS